MHSDQNVKNTDGFTRDVIQRLLTLNYWRWFVLRRRRCHEVTEVEEVKIVGIAPRAIRRGAFAKRALHSPPAPAKGDKKRFDKLSVPLQPIGSATALRQAQRTKGRNKGQGVSRLNGLALR